MNPATQEYFHTYEILKDELSSYKIQQADLQFQISKLLEENKRLYGELKENARRQELQSSENGFGDLERKLDAALAAKNAAMEMWQQALKQLEEQESMLMGKKSLVEAERTESGKLIEQVKEEYVKGLNILSSEVTNYRNELANATQELKSNSEDLNKCRGELEAAKKEASQVKLALSEATKLKVESEEKVKSLQALLTEAESFLKVTKDEMAKVKAKNSKLERMSTDLKEQNKNLKAEMVLLEKDGKQSLLTAQDAVLRKKEMAFKEEQYCKDIEHLKSAIELEAEAIGLKHKAEVKEIQKEHSKKIMDLMEEIQSLHQENSDKQSLFEKATREKQALESKLELLYSEFSSGNPVTGGVMDDLCRRLTMAEKMRDEFQFRVRSLQTDLQELKCAKEQEFQCCKEEQNSLRDRLQKVMEDFNKSSCDRLQLCEEVTTLKKTNYSLEKELKHVKEKGEKEISLVKDQARQLQESLTQQLKANEERYKTTCGELQGLLTAEFGISSKWKEEAENLIAKSEAKIKELCQTIVQLQSENKALGGRNVRDVYGNNYGTNRLLALTRDIDN